ncbi:hypothetical protein HDU97_009258, partial [Phlyctochytrium planicorne]
MTTLGSNVHMRTTTSPSSSTATSLLQRIKTTLRSVDKPKAVVVFISVTLLFLWLTQPHQDHGILSLTTSNEEMDDFEEEKLHHLGDHDAGQHALDMMGSDTPDDQCDHNGPSRSFQSTGHGQKKKKTRRRKCSKLIQNRMINASILYSDNYIASRKNVSLRLAKCGDWDTSSKMAPLDAATEALECNPEVVAVVASCTPNLSAFIESSDRAKIGFRVIWSQHWGGSGHRVRIAHTYLRTLPSRKLVILALAADEGEMMLLPSCSAKTLEDRYLDASLASANDAPVIAAAEKIPWPDVELKGAFDEIASETARRRGMDEIEAFGVSGFRYANGGILVGEAWALLDVLSSIYTSDCDENSYHPRRMRQVHQHKLWTQSDIDISRSINRAYISKLGYETPDNTTARMPNKHEDMSKMHRHLLDRFFVEQEMEAISNASLSQAGFLIWGDEEKTTLEVNASANVVKKKPVTEKLSVMGAPRNNTVESKLPGVNTTFSHQNNYPNEMGDEEMQRQKEIQERVQNSQPPPPKKKKRSTLASTVRKSYKPYLGLDYWNNLIQTLTGVDLTELELGSDNQREWLKSRHSSSEPCIVYHKHGNKIDSRKMEAIRKHFKNLAAAPPAVGVAVEEKGEEARVPRRQSIISKILRRLAI